MLSIGSIVLGVTDVRRAVEFWARALPLTPRDGVVEEDWTVLVPTDGSGVQIALGRSETLPQSHPRIHLDLYAGDADQAAEVERLVSLGAKRVDWDSYPPDPDFVVLADPDDNVFCVIDTGRSGE